MATCPKTFVWYELVTADLGASVLFLVSSLDLRSNSIKCPDSRSGFRSTVCSTCQSATRRSRPSRPEQKQSQR
jgi:hypothetical protein